MLNTFKKRCFAGLLAGALCLTTIVTVDATSNNSANDKVIAVNNSAVTSCWTGTCGHTSESYSYPSYSVSGGGTLYRSLGYYCDPKNNVTVSDYFEYTSTISAGLEFGSDNAKASLGVSGSLTTGYSISTNLTNNTSSRQYVHAGATYANRSNTITKKTRTYYPYYDLLGINNYCTFTYSSCYPSGKIKTSMGYSLLSSVRNDF
jgi:hypothetical protein